MVSLYLLAASRISPTAQLPQSRDRPGHTDGGARRGLPDSGGGGNAVAEEEE